MAPPPTEPRDEGDGLPFAEDDDAVPVEGEFDQVPDTSLDLVLGEGLEEEAGPTVRDRIPIVVGKLESVPPPATPAQPAAPATPATRTATPAPATLKHRPKLLGRPIVERDGRAPPRDPKKG